MYLLYRIIYMNINIKYIVINLQVFHKSIMLSSDVYALICND